jgi:glucose/arabinose dehydrogenase
MTKSFQSKVFTLLFLATIISACVAQPVTGTPVIAPPTVKTNTVIPSLEPTGDQQSLSPDAIKTPDQVRTISPADIPLNPTALNLEVIAEGLYVPWSIVFTSPQRLLVTERNGFIREIVNNQLKPTPLITFPEVAARQEAGLLGLALDPAYNQNKFLYACLTIQRGDAFINRVVKLREMDSFIEVVEVIIDDIPAAANHAGGRIHFGPDGMLYITSGDAQRKDLAQDQKSLAGKILRINADGSIPADNPFPGSPVFALGLRNSQGFDWHPLNGFPYLVEHGPSGFDGTPGGDEMNLLQPGGNYGWPLVSHTKMLAGTLPPLVEFTPAIAPASGLFYKGSLFPQFMNSFLFGGLRGEGLFRMVIEINDPYRFSIIDRLNIDVGRIREVVQASDGSIYFTTSNRDGRGQVRSGDDKVYRITPQ